MSKPLSEIIYDGSLVDNTVHRMEHGVFRVGLSEEGVPLRWGKSWNNPKHAWPVMLKAANLPLDEGKVVFRYPTAEYEHNTGDPLIRLAGVDPSHFVLTTGNLIGAVKDGDYTLRVSSRFGDEFLKYIIADADGFLELPDQGGMAEGGFEWLLIYIWLIKLKKGFRLGLPKTYQTRVEDLRMPRGRIDPVDYWRRHDLAIYRCAYREHSYDNPATRLIARTLKHLDSHSLIRQSHTLNNTFQIATHGARSSLRELLETPPIRNPFYADYNPVIDLSKRILRNDLADAGADSDASAFLFDVSMLFEFFIRKLLMRAGAVFHDKNDSQWSIPRGLSSGAAARKIIPDLVFELDGAVCVFDVKYKSFHFREGVAREDLFQLHTYLGQVSNRYDVAGCGLIYPVRESRWVAAGLDSSHGVLSQQLRQSGRTLPFHVAFLKVPEKNDLAQEDWPTVFRRQFQRSAEQFVRALLVRIRAKPHSGARKASAYAGQFA